MGTRATVQTHFGLLNGKTEFLQGLSSETVPLVLSTQSDLEVGGDFSVVGDFALTEGLTIGGNITLGDSFAADETTLLSQARMSAGTPGRPSLAWKDAGTDWDFGLYSSGPDVIRVALTGTAFWEFNSSVIGSANSSGAALGQSLASTTNPSLRPNKGDVDTGIGWTSADIMNLICGGSTIMELNTTAIKPLMPLHVIDGATGAGNLSIAWEDAGGAWDFGMYSDADNTIKFYLGDGTYWAIDKWHFGSAASGGAAVRQTLASNTEPSLLVNKGRTDLGVGTAADHQLSLIARNVEGLRVTSLGSGTAILSEDVTAGLTAFATGGQGSAVQLASSINEISTVGTGGDSVKLPAGVLGMKIIIINNGANACDVFPFVGDDIGAGVNTAISLAAGNKVSYECYATNTWA